MVKIKLSSWIHSNELDEDKWEEAINGENPVSDRVWKSDNMRTFNEEHRGDSDDEGFETDKEENDNTNDEPEEDINLKI